MIHEFVMKVLGAGIAAVVFFLPLGLRLEDGTLTVEAQLTAPVTEDTGRLIEHGYTFRIEYYCSVIINDRQAHSGRVVSCLSHDGTWRLNGDAVPADEVQRRMGAARFDLPGVAIAEGDEALVFVKAVILPDSTFRQSTGLSTRVLWNHYVPRLKERWVGRGGGLERR